MGRWRRARGGRGLAAAGRARGGAAGARARWPCAWQACGLPERQQALGGCMHGCCQPAGAHGMQRSHACSCEAMHAQPRPHLPAQSWRALYVSRTRHWLRRPSHETPANFENERDWLFAAASGGTSSPGGRGGGGAMSAQRCRIAEGCARAGPWGGEGGRGWGADFGCGAPMVPRAMCPEAARALVRECAWSCVLTLGLGAAGHTRRAPPQVRAGSPRAVQRAAAWHMRGTAVGARRRYRGAAAVVRVGDDVFRCRRAVLSCAPRRWLN